MGRSPPASPEVIREAGAGAGAQRQTEKRSVSRPRARSRAGGYAVPSGLNDRRPAAAIGAAGFGHRIIAAAAPGVAAGEPPRREANTDNGTVPPYRFDRIVRAARQIPTGGREERREKQLINADQPLQYQDSQPLKALAIHLTLPPPHPAGLFSGPGRFGAVPHSDRR